MRGRKGRIGSGSRRGSRLTSARLVVATLASAAVAVAACGNSEISIRPAVPASSVDPAVGSVSRPDFTVSPATSVPAVVTGSLTCGSLDVVFPALVLGQPADAERGSSPAAVSLRALLGSEQADELGLPDRGWWTAITRDDSVTFIARSASGWAFTTMTNRRGAGWDFHEGGECALRPALPAGFGFATWQLDPGDAPDATATSVKVLATELACANGKPPGARMIPPIVMAVDDAVTIGLEVRLIPGGADCPGNPEVPVSVSLDGPLGARHLLDGSAFPPALRR